MKVSRRGFIGSAIKGAALVALAPLISKLPEAKAEEPKEVITANIVPREGFDCRNYVGQVTIQEYRPGETMRYQDLNGDPSCKTCLYDSLHPGRCDTVIDPTTLKNVRRHYRGPNE